MVAIMYQQRNINYVNVKDYGAQGDGVADDTAAITSAVNVVKNAGGTVFFPAGTYITATQLLYSKMHLIGAGIEASIIKLKNATNADLLQGSINGYGGTLVNVGAANATGLAGGIYNWSIRDLTLDGNKANQSSGMSYCMRFYGYGYILQNVRIRNGYSGGVLSDWNGGAASPGGDAMEAQWTNIKIHDCNNIGLQIGGPHDSQFVNMDVYNCGMHDIHIAPNATAVQMCNVHAWNIGTGACGFLIEAGYCLLYNCESEITTGMSVAMLASECTWDGHFFDASATNGSNGLQIGQQAGNTPYTGMIQQSAGVTAAVQVANCHIRGNFDYCGQSHGAIWFANSSGGNMVLATIYQTGGSGVTGTPSVLDDFWIMVKGLTPDGTLGKGGGCHISGGNTQAFYVQDLSGTDILNVNTTNKRVEMPNATELKAYSDAYSTVLYDFTSTLALFNIATKIANSANQAFEVNDGTIDIFNINTSNKRVEIVNNTLVRIYSDAYSTTVFQANATGHGEVQLGNAGSLYSGSGVPSNGLGSNGDYYFRTDTPAMALQRIYVKASGAWAGVI